MSEGQSIHTRRAETCTKDPVAAVTELAEKLGQADMAAVLFFCSADYDLAALAGALNDTFSCPVFGCTTAGEIGSTYQHDGIVAASFSSEVFRFHLMAIEPLTDFTLTQARECVDKLRSRLQFSASLDAEKMFGLLLIDGLSLKEDQVTSCLHSVLEGVSLAGGSAADNMHFQNTFVFVDGAFRSGAAVFALVETKLDFEIFKFQHVLPSDEEMIITEADPANRVVYEINGAPAATELARIIGTTREQLTSEIYSTNPLMLQVGSEWFVRSIITYNPDDSLSFYCAIDAGLPLSVGKMSDLVEYLDKQVSAIKAKFADIEISIGFDCTHRRLEIMERGLKKEVEHSLRDLNIVAFSTYGEQYNSIHVNQTFTGVVLGSRKGW